ncbi:MAG: response regulator transcription factor [Nitrospirota bacterium]|jgi:two-component system invasion response regulator UvrY
MKKVQILIADDHPIVRMGLRQILEETMGSIDVDEAENGQSALDKAAKQHYDIMLLDIAMPGLNGLDALKLLRTQCPKLPVLMLSMYPEDLYAVRALRAGAAGYLTKSSAPDELFSAIEKILSGKKFVSASLAERLALELEGNNRERPHENLSDREYQVMLLIASGKTISDIAQDLSLSVKTVSTYRTRVLEKMNMKSNAELIHYALKSGLIS